MRRIILLTVFIIMIPILLIKNTDVATVKIKYGIYSNKKIKVKRTKTNEVILVPLEEYVKGVVAGEMPALFNEEALKAQAVASRTYALNKAFITNKEYDVTDDTSYQVYLDDNEIKEKYKEKYEEYLKIIKKAVYETKGEVVLYDNNLIDALFFSTSNGYTENSGDIFQKELPYLASVSSPWDEEESPVFESLNEFSKKTFLHNLGLNENDEIIINNIEKTNTGRVKQITINNQTYKASEIRNIFNLKSTSFSITTENDKVIFKVNGYGHGVGLSQYGANGMAKKGYNYKEILLYYYKNCEIKKIN